MKRRSFLAGTVGGAGLLAGCGGRSETDAQYTPTPEPTPPPDVSTETPVSVPEPNGVNSADAAVQFVSTYESRYIHNELVDGFGSSQPATEITVEPASVEVVHTTENGYYLLSTCRGSAEYYQADGSSGASRNAVSVAQFVGGDSHRRIPFNYYSCEQPSIPTPTEGESGGGNQAESEPLARLQLYDFETPPDYENPDEGCRTVEVTVRDATGSVVLQTGYQASLPLTVQPRVVEEPGAYTITARLEDGTTAEYEWSPTSPTAPSWWATAIVVTNAGDLTIQRFYPDETVGLPPRTLCGRRR